MCSSDLGISSKAMRRLNSLGATETPEAPAIWQAWVSRAPQSASTWATVWASVAGAGDALAPPLGAAGAEDGDGAVGFLDCSHGIHLQFADAYRGSCQNAFHRTDS